MAELKNPRQKLRLGDLLVQNRIISEQQLQQALAEQKSSGHKLGRVLVQLGLIGEDALLQFLGEQLGLAIVDLKHYRFRPESVRLLPEQHARRYRAIVLAEKRNELTVGMADPTDLFAYDELRRILKRPIDPALVRETDLLAAIDLMYRRTEEISSLAEELGEELGESDYDLAELDSESAADDAPVIKLLRSMFEDAVQIGASDIHIEPDEAVVRIRLRVDGELQEQVIEGRRIASALVTRLKLMAALNISEKRLPQDGRFTIRVRKRRIDVRLSTMPVQYGESVVLRLLDQSGGLLELEKLGLPDDLLPRFKRVISRRQGMLLVTGPTGSGKTTTLYAALNRINRPELKIITAEDPVEYRLPRINQVQVHPKIGLDFARVLRTALRQDPDVIMVGEMRDRETAEIGLRAAMTGHLVLSTLHTNNAIDTVTRLLDMGAEGFMVATSLQAVIAQRLVRRICDSCEQPDELTPQQRAWLAAERPGALPDPLPFKHGIGCTYCNNTGYRGRIGVYEMLEIDQPLADALRRGDAARFSELARRQPGFRTLVERALDYAEAGHTSLDEAIALSGGTDELPVPPPPVDEEASA
ncbi:MAG: ATPase, T2SS/T4P/T4SS family [Wenzhouxiangellaceae bacterium]|nr:ATPase, T2SS/T4P/T4SS family [Wenzhouxiangellaceae bacterium]